MPWGDRAVAGNRGQPVSQNWWINRGIQDLPRKLGWCLASFCLAILTDEYVVQLDTDKVNKKMCGKDYVR